MSDKQHKSGATLAGLREALPEDEHVIWQCSPGAVSIARHALFASWVAGYFAILALSAAVAVLRDGGSIAAAFSASWHLIAIGAVTTAALTAIGALIRRSTVYSITSKRVVMQVGMAVPLQLNLPFNKIASADIKLYADGSGDIALTPAEKLPVSYIHLWPHVRGLFVLNPRPALKSIENARDVSALLVKAMLESGVACERRAIMETNGVEGKMNVRGQVAAMA